jgi:hypothetical protein
MDRILGPEDFAAIQRLKHRKLVEAAMAKHGLKVRSWWEAAMAKVGAGALRRAGRLCASLCCAALARAAATYTSRSATGWVVPSRAR